MITVKILCGCGQKYAFDVEPYQGRMPSSIQCPVCKADGTQAANEIIARSLPPPPSPAIAPAPPPPQMIAPAPRPMTAVTAGGGLRIGGSAPAAAAIPPAPIMAAVSSRAASAIRRELEEELEIGPGGADDKWKWWYYIVAGIGIIGYDAFMLYDTHEMKYVGGVFLGIFCICIGVWDFNRKRAIRRKLHEG